MNDMNGIWILEALIVVSTILNTSFNISHYFTNELKAYILKFVFYMYVLM